MKTALITGASRGIGRAVARELAHQGWAVGINYLNRTDKARELVEEARRVARNYAGGDHGRFSRIWRDLSPAVYTLMGAAAIGLIWLIVALI